MYLKMRILIIFFVSFEFTGHSSATKSKKPVSTYGVAVQKPAFVGSAWTKIKNNTAYGAAINGDMGTLLAELAKGYDPNKKLRYSKNTALHFAAEKGHLPIIMELVKHGARINSYNGKGLSPLHIALQFRQLKVAEWLIEQGADIYIPNEKNYGKSESVHLSLEIAIAEWKKLFHSKIEVSPPDRPIKYYIPEDQLEQYSHLPIEGEDVVRQREKIQQLISGYGRLILIILEKGEINIPLFLKKLPEKYRERLKAQTTKGGPCQASFQ